MSKVFKAKWYMIIGVVLLCVGGALLCRSWLNKKEILATVSPLNIELGLPVAYADSTRGAHKWLWEFGNGDYSPLQNGVYRFEEAGKYRIRLTVNGKLKKQFVVTVRPKKRDNESQLIRIDAPHTALQDEYVIFRGEGASNEWRWEFGETGLIDAKEKTAIYKYSFPGTYEVLLSTEETKYPIRHIIEITPQYMDNDSTDLASLIGNDIKGRLQAIVDREPFNMHYNYVLDKYLCGNPNVLVVVNNSKKNDFYSYCQGLRIIGHRQTSIENVVVVLDGNENEEEACVKKMIVLQNDANP